MYSILSDIELAALLREGDNHAFTEIYNRYWNKLLAIAYNHTRDKSDAEEIVQEVFVTLWNKRDQVNILYPERYFATAVKFTVFNNYYRKKKRTDDMISKMPYQESYEIEGEIAARFLQEQIDGIISALPEKCRLVFQYSREKGMKNSQIAKEMGIAEKTVEAHLNKALKTIKGKLPDNGVLLILLAEYLNRK